MVRRCSWCGVNMGEKEPIKDLTVTHGICVPCIEKLKDQMFWRSRVQAFCDQDLAAGSAGAGEADRDLSAV